MNAVLGAEPVPFLALTVILFGLAALATGRGLADAWRPARQIIPCALLLAAADRFLLYALFEAPLLSPSGFLAAASVLGLVMSAAYFRARARKMVRQYPWLYEPSGPFGWRARGPHSGSRG